MKTDAEYAMICIHCLVWGIVLEISNERDKKKSSVKKFWAEAYNN